MSHRDKEFCCKICGGELPYSKANLCISCKTRMLDEKWLCHCGCGTEINRWNLSHNGIIRERKFIRDHNCSRDTKSGIYKCECCNRTFSDPKSIYRHIDNNRCVNKERMEEFKINWNKMCECGCGEKLRIGSIGHFITGHKIPWNKGLTKHDDERLMINSERRIKEMQNVHNKSGVWMSHTKPELKVKEFLQTLNIEFQHQWSFFYKYNVDFGFPTLKKLIEVDGDYWHTKDLTVIEKDIAENNFIIEKGWKCLRLWGSDINLDFEVCKNKILEFLEIKNVVIN